MKSNAATPVLPEHLRATYRLLQSAFPEPIDRKAYLPLLALLGQDMSDRNLAEVVARVFGIDYDDVLNDIYRARSVDVPPAEALEKIKQQLLPHGYENWSREQ
jgi:hypothetical protein